MVNPSSPAPYRLRALALAELLDEAFRIYRREFALFLGLALVVTLPGLVMGLLAGSYRSAGWMTKFIQSLGNSDAMQTMAQSPPPQSDPTLSFLGTLVRLILVPVTLGVVVYTTNEILHGRTPGIVDALEGTLRRYGALAALSVLIGAMAASSFLVLTIPVVVLVLVRWAVSVPALLVEGLGPSRAVGRSWSLVEGRWWRTLGIVLVVLLLTWVASAILGATGGAVIGLVPGLTDDQRGALIVVTGSLAGALVLPVNYIAITLIYYDLRVRREGFDLDQLAQQAQPPSAA
jgi:hypothetical protein